MKIAEKIRIFWEKYDNKVVLFVGILLVAIVSYEIGFMEGHKIEQKSLVIEKAPALELPSAKDENSSVLGAQSSEELKDVTNSTDNKDCVFVGSKNSNKYHTLDSPWAKRIKPENRVCFKSKEEAQAKGYIASSSVK